MISCVAENKSTNKIRNKEFKINVFFKFSFLIVCKAVIMWLFVKDLENEFNTMPDCANDHLQNGSCVLTISLCPDSSRSDQGSRSDHYSYV